ncbi:MAG: GntR family transcriptional regulator [Planctomycetes bacterium]|nr:GntR family transcriptional regulator [Planctomycetota bacterium]
MKAAIPPELRDLASEPGTSVPKYARLSEAMLAAVASGHWRPGERLPNEAALARLLPFSLGTVQRALRQLAEDGVIVRRQKRGTYVAPLRPAMKEPWHCRFLNEDGSGFLPVFPKVVKRERTLERGPWSRHLGGPPEGAVQIDRLLDIGGEFCVYSRFFLDAARFSSLLKRPLAELDAANFKLVLAREFHLPAVRFAHTLQALTLPRAVNQVLQLPLNTGGTLLEASASSPQGASVYFQQIFIPPNHRKLVVSDVPGTWAPSFSNRKAAR